MCQNLDDLLKQMQSRGESIVVAKNRTPVAALVDYALNERTCRLRESFMALTDRLNQVYADVPAEATEAEIYAAVRRVRRRRPR